MLQNTGTEGYTTETRECGTSKDKIYHIQKILRNTMGAEKCITEPPCVQQRCRPDNPHQLSYLLLKTSTLQTHNLCKSPDGVTQLSSENAVHLPTRSCPCYMCCEHILHWCVMLIQCRYSIFWDAIHHSLAAANLTSFGLL